MTFLSGVKVDLTLQAIMRYGKHHRRVTLTPNSNISATICAPCPRCSGTYETTRKGTIDETEQESMAFTKQCGFPETRQELHFEDFEDSENNTHSGFAALKGSRSTWNLTLDITIIRSLPKVELILHDSVLLHMSRIPWITVFKQNLALCHSFQDFNGQLSLPMETGVDASVHPQHLCDRTSEGPRCPVL